MNISEIQLKQALTEAFDEGMTGYAEFKDDVIAKIMGELKKTEEYDRKCQEEMRYFSNPSYVDITGKVHYTR
ncbi:MAG: hypothetical protein DWQ19_10605 [Crenarchaeota archaeon]|nr:MAG: hypothetical protein DWQ19_10605 [Thermoproteota archaeon]